MAQFSHIISAIDAHTAGEPTRIILSGLPPILGGTLADKKRWMMERQDHFRTLLMREPRGHRDMFGVILTPPARPKADYGLLFIDNSGYLDMCGHGVMSAATAFIETGMVAPVEPETAIVFDTPAGLVEARARIENSRVVEVSLANVPSFLHAADVPVELPGIGRITLDVSFGGNFFALVSAKSLGVSIHPGNINRLVELGLAIKQAVNAKLAIGHPDLDHINQVELVEIYDRPEESPLYARNVVVFGDGQLDRSPCGTGTSAAMAALYAKGGLPVGAEYVNEGIVGTRFRGKIVREVSLVSGLSAVEPVITGSAYITGIQQFVVDPNDPFRHGFLLGAF